MKTLWAAQPGASHSDCRALILAPQSQDTAQDDASFWGFDCLAPGQGLCDRVYRHLGVPESKFVALKHLPQVSPGCLSCAVQCHPACLSAKCSKACCSSTVLTLSAPSLSDSLAPSLSDSAGTRFQPCSASATGPSVLEGAHVPLEGGTTGC